MSTASNTDVYEMMPQDHGDSTFQTLWTCFSKVSDILYNLILPAALGPGVYSDSNRNEYQKHKNNVSGE
jgi:hypothetical protein